MIPLAYNQSLALPPGKANVSNNLQRTDKAFIPNRQNLESRVPLFSQTYGVFRAFFSLALAGPKANVFNTSGALPPLPDLTNQTAHVTLVL
jgi:hypothetical protein